MQDYYAVLDLPITATTEQIDTRYRQLVRMFDPGLYDDPEELAYIEKKLTAVHHAYAVLCCHPEEQVISRLIDLSIPEIISPADATKSMVEFIDVAGSRWRIPLRAQRCAHKGSTRWLHKFALSIVTIFVSALIGSAALDQGLGVLAYVKHSQQRISAPSQIAAQVEQPIAQSVDPFATNANIADRTPIYSVDQRQVAFIATVMGKTQVFLNDPATRKVRPLTQAVQLRSRPSWSSQGDKLAFLEDSASGVIIQIFALATNRFYSFQPSRLLGQVGRAGWSHDGRSIFFEYTGQNPEKNGELWYIDSLGQNVKRYDASRPPVVIWWSSMPSKN